MIVEDLRIEFQVRASDDKEDTPSSIKVYNLADASAARIQSKGEAVLNVGYGAPNELIFNGVVRTVEHRREGVDRITELFVAPKDHDSNTTIWYQGNSGAAESGVRGITWRNEVWRLSRVMGVDIDLTSLNAVPNEPVPVRWHPVEGSEDTPYYTPVTAGSTPSNVDPDWRPVYFDLATRPRDKLTNILRPFNLSWSIDNESVLHITRVGDRGFASIVDYDEPPGQLISEDTVMIGTPDYIDDDRQEVRVRIVMTSSAAVGVRFRLSSHDANGVFVTTRVTHKGDTWSGDWFTELEGGVESDQSILDRITDWSSNLASRFFG